MGITLANFQLKAIEALMEAMGEPNRDIILKSCTGSRQNHYPYTLYG